MCRFEAGTISLVYYRWNEGSPSDDVNAAVGSYIIEPVPGAGMPVMTGIPVITGTPVIPYMPVIPEFSVSLAHSVNRNKR